MKIKEMFADSIFYINLDSRKDRNSSALDEFVKMGISPMRVSGIVFDGKYQGVKDDSIRNRLNGIVGCMLSHRNILNYALSQKTNVLIFEDDVKFINDYRNIVENALDELPEKWDMFYLGGNICNTITQVSKYLGRLTHAQSTHAYAINKNFVETLLNFIPMDKIIPLDLVYASIIPSFHCYITIPMVAVQKKSFSDIEGLEVEYESWMEKRFYDQLKPLKGNKNE